MPVYGIVPDDMFSPERKDEVIIFLRLLDAPPRRKKQTLVEWSQAVGIGLTKEDFQKLLGIHSSEV